MKTAETKIIAFFHRVYLPFARLALFVVYFWFGALKAAGMSPAAPLVQELFEKTASGVVSFPLFYGSFAVFEMLIGALFLLRGMERLAVALTGAHLIMTASALVFLPSLAWQGWLAPTLAGQYIIKNILIVALAMVVGAYARTRSADPTAERL